jgi:hypothetical protein
METDMKRLAAFISGICQYRLVYPSYYPNPVERSAFYAGRDLARRLARLPEG